jgi:hypothetical protein
VCVTFAAGKFPMAFEVSTFWTQRQKKMIVALDHGGDDNDRVPRLHREPWNYTFAASNYRRLRVI